MNDNLCKGSGLVLGRRKFLSAAVAVGTAGYIPQTALSPPHSPPCSLPFAGAPSAETWFLTQWYGNTAFAYRMRDEFYESGQGLHFGIDLSAPCNTPILAIGDGRVVEIDGVRRAWPHHLILEHENGLYSLYGHLRERSRLQVGDTVQRGAQVGISGDSATHHCDGSPHLHLEIRSERLNKATNPIHWIEADWPAATLGLTEAHFQMDLHEPTRWQSIYEQPDIRFWDPITNNYNASWSSNAR